MTNPADFHEYSDDEILTVRAAYHDIFGRKLSDALVDYLDIGPVRGRPWSCLTTDFRHVTLDQLRAIHEQTARDDMRFRAGYRAALSDGRLEAYCIHQGHELVQAAERRSRASNIALGYSIGICPWTDHGLLATWSEKKTRAIIIVGHDWYPIVPAGQDGPHPLDAPLFKRGLHMLAAQPANKRAQLYVQAAPSAVYEGESVMLFMNLVPEYRPPATAVKGKWVKDYRPYLPGFKAAVEAVVRRYGPDQVQLISWGAPVWEVVRHLFPPFKKTGVMAMAKAMQGQAFRFGMDGCAIDYLALAHPSDSRNFRNDARWRHLQHVVEGYQRMGLGKPGV